MNAHYDPAQQGGTSYADAEPQQDFGDLIPDGVLAFGVLNIRPHNADQGMIVTPSKSSEARYLDCEVTIMQGPFDKRKLWTRIGVAGSDKYVAMGKSAIKAILETGKNAGPQNPNGYYIPHGHDGQPAFEYLDGLVVAVKIKIEPGKDGYRDKNDIALFLSPVDPVTQKTFERLRAGDIFTKGQGSPAAKPQAPANPWASAPQPAQGQLPGVPSQQGQPVATTPAPQPQPQQPQAAPAAPAAPNWLPAKPADDTPPFTV